MAAMEPAQICNRAGLGGGAACLKSQSHARVRLGDSLRGASGLLAEALQVRAGMSPLGLGSKRMCLGDPGTHLLLGGVVLSSARGSLGRGKAVPKELWQLAEDLAGLEEGPIELPADFDPLGNVSEFSPLQIGASFVLTGALAFLLYRAVVKRLKRAKELQFRSSGAAKASDLAEEARKAAILGLRREPEVQTPPPNAVQTLFGALVAGAISLVLYKFTATVEAGFAERSVSPDYSIRNITITVRTIINGLCYLSTFVFAANSVGLTLYSLQLALFPSGFSSDSSSSAPPIEEKEGERRVD